MKSLRPDGPEQDPERWSAQPAADTATGAAGAALRQVREATEPTGEEVARLGVLFATAEARAARGTWRWRLALAALLLFSTGGVVGAAGLLLRWARSAPPAAITKRIATRIEPPASTIGKARVRGTSPDDLPPPIEEAPPLVPSPPPAIVPMKRRSTTVPALVPPVAPSASAPAAPITEAGLLAEAFRVLRAERDAAAALQTLDQYDRKYPGGTLAAEAQVARVEALMALGRRADALAVLAAFDGQQSEPTRNVLVSRGELFAEAGQCQRAVGDFDRILAAAEHGDAEARALFGRGACRLRKGDVAAGQQDLRRYLDLYPVGAFAKAARAALPSPP
jgi:TolA-binding protein